MTQNDWDVNPDSYVKDDDGNFVLKKDGTPRKKAGRSKGSGGRGYNYHSKTKAKLSASKKIREKKKKIAQARSSIARHQESLKKTEKALDILEDKSKNRIVEETFVEEASPLLQAELKENVIFQPNEGPQMDFLAAGETDVLYGGAAGGGKSYAMLVDPLRFAHRAAHRALILRRSMPELRELIDKSRELYPKAFPGCKYREVEKLWTFPSGAKVEFGFLERDADVYRYQGQAYSWIGFDEITHLPTEFSWNYLASRLRTTDSEITPYMRCTANPGGVGAGWVKKRYISPSVPNDSFIGDDGITRKFIPARLNDNPYLAQDGRYEQMLKSLPPTQRKQLLEGNWEIAEGAAFTEFDRDMHIIEPFDIPLHWERVKGLDYGYASESACVWATIDPNDNTLIIYRELYRKNLLATELAEMLTNMELNDPMSVRGVLDTACWSRTGTTGPTVAETLIQAGHKLRPADKNRIAGKIQIHEHLKVQPSGRPRMQIFNTCPNLIRELQSIPLDKNNPEDVNTHAADHAYDALRYLIMSRPRIQDPLSQIRDLQREQHFQPFDSTFGY
ncbi:MAG: terminase large subunit domain-containing protein [Flavobacteriaceae bacterium]